MSELLLAPNKTFNSERFAALPKRALKNANAILTSGDRYNLSLFYLKGTEWMDNIKIYEVEEAYVEYLAPLAPHLFLN